MTYQLNLCVLQDDRGYVWGLDGAPKLRKIYNAFMATDSEMDEKMSIAPKRFDFFGENIKMRSLFHAKPRSASPSDQVYVVLVFHSAPSKIKPVIKIKLDDFFKTANHKPVYLNDKDYLWDWLFLGTNHQLIVRALETKPHPTIQPKIFTIANLLKMSETSFKDLEQEEEDSISGFVDQLPSQIAASYLRLHEKEAAAEAKKAEEKAIEAAARAAEQSSVPPILSLFSSKASPDSAMKPVFLSELRPQAVEDLKSEELSETNNPDGIIKSIFTDAVKRVYNLNLYYNDAHKARSELGFWLQDNTVLNKVRNKEIPLEQQTILVAKTFAFLLALESGRRIPLASVWTTADYRGTAISSWVTYLLPQMCTWQKLDLAHLISIKVLKDQEQIQRLSADYEDPKNGTRSNCFLMAFVSKWDLLKEELWTDKGISENLAQFLRMAGDCTTKILSLSKVRFFGKLFNVDSKLPQDTAFHILQGAFSGKVPELADLVTILRSASTISEVIECKSNFCVWYFKAITESHQQTRMRGSLSNTSRKELRSNFENYVRKTIGNSQRFLQDIDRSIDYLWISLLETPSLGDTDYVRFLIRHHSQPATLLSSVPADIARIFFDSTAESHVFKVLSSFFPIFDPKGEQKTSNAALKIDLRDICRSIQIGIFSPEFLESGFAILPLESLVHIYKLEKQTASKDKTSDASLLDADVAQLRLSKLELIFGLLKEGVQSEKHHSFIQIIQCFWELNFRAAAEDPVENSIAARSVLGDEAIKNGVFNKFALWMHDFISLECVSDNSRFDVLRRLSELVTEQKQKKRFRTYFGGKSENILQLFVKDSKIELNKVINEKLQSFDKIKSESQKITKAISDISMPDDSIKRKVEKLSEFCAENSTTKLSDIQRYCEENSLSDLHIEREVLVYYNKNKESTFFINYHQPEKSGNEVKDALTAIKLARTKVQEKLAEIAKDPKAFSYQFYQEYCRDKGTPFTADQFKRQLHSLGVPESEVTKLVQMLEAFQTFLRLAKIFYSESLEQLMKFDYYSALQNSPEFQKITKVKSKFPEITKSVPQNSSQVSKKISLEKWVQTIVDWKTTISDTPEVKELVKDKAFMNCNVDIIELLSDSKAEELLQFVADIDELFFTKVRDECDLSLLDLTIKLRNAKTNLDFMLKFDPTTKKYKGTPKELLDGLFKLTKNDESEISDLKSQLQNLKRLKSKIQGDKKKLAEECLTMCYATFKRIGVRQTFEYKLVNPGIEVGKLGLQEEDRLAKFEEILKLEGFDSNLDETKLNASTADPKPQENQQQIVPYEFEEMQSNFAYFSILKTELQAKLSSPTKDANQTELKEQEGILKIMEAISSMGEQLNLFRLNLCKMYEIGLVRDSFHDKLIEYFSTSLNRFRAGRVSEKDTEHRKLILWLDKDCIDKLKNLNKSLDELYNTGRKKYLEEIKRADKYGLNYLTGAKMYRLLQIRYFNTVEDKSATQELLYEAQNSRAKEIEINAVGKDNKMKLDQVLEDCFEKYFDKKILPLSDSKSLPILSRSGANIVNLRKAGVEKQLNSVEIILKILKLITTKVSPNLNLSQILFCNDQTTELEIKSFVSRSVYDQSSRPFFILNPKELTHARLTDLIEQVTSIVSPNTGGSAGEEPNKSTSGQGYLVILNNGTIDLFPNVECFDDITSNVQHLLREEEKAQKPAEMSEKTGEKTTPAGPSSSKSPSTAASSPVIALSKSECRKAYFNSLSTCFLVESKQAGYGKTYWIRNQAHDLIKKGQIKELVELSISGEINKVSLAKRIDRLQDQLKSRSESDQVALHIKLDYIDEFEKHRGMIDYLLYGLCFARKVEADTGITDLQRKVSYIYVEIGNSMAAKINDLDVIRVIKSWNSQEAFVNGQITSSTNLVKEIPAFSEVEINSGFSKDSIYYALAAALKQFESAKKDKKGVWKTIPIPEITPPGGNTELLDVSAAAGSEAAELSKKIDEQIASYGISQSEMNQILKKHFAEVDQTYHNFVCFEYWCKYLALLIKDFQECKLFVKDAATSALTSSFDGEDRRLVQEVLEEIFESAKQNLMMHHLQSADIQREIIEIYESGDDAIMEHRLAAKKEKLKAAIEKDTWVTSKLVIPIFSEKDLIPVLGNDAILDSRPYKPGEQDMSHPRACLNRYISSLKSQFDSQINPEEKGDQASFDHAWYAYCLSKMPLNGQYRAFEDIRQTAATFKGKGYAFTAENFVKIVVMLNKAKLKQPIIIMGESGCGKTYLSEFVVKGLLKDSMKIETLYSGYSEKNLLKFIAKCVAESLELKKVGKNLWVFFDEFNTTAIQSIIADLLLDRVYPTQGTENSDQESKDSGKSFKRVPDNMIFIACCNPFRIKLDKTDDSMIGLVPHNKSSKLSHIVKPIPERLLSLVLDFGQLSDEDEKHHIQTMVDSEKLFRYSLECIVQEPENDPFDDADEDKKSLNKIWQLANLTAAQRLTFREQTKLNQKLSLLIHKVHSFVRDKEERSGVSLRDIKRVCIFFKWFRKAIFHIRQMFLTDPAFREHLQDSDFWIARSPKSVEIAASLCSVMVCYSLRMNGQRDQLDLLKRMHHWILYVCGYEDLSITNVEQTLMHVATAYLYSIRKLISEDVSQNQAFKENFIALLACYANQIPLIIVGAPGTSKTLSTSSFLQVLDNKSQSKLLDKFYEPETIYFGGSETSTSLAVEALFERANRYYKNQQKQLKEHDATAATEPKGQAKPIKAPIVFFDELGLAELSPYNPLKVMHSKLETNMGKIAFIGISNWKPDQSKVNRMVCLMRPDMSKNDLISIFEVSLKSLKHNKEPGINKSLADKNMAECFRPLFDCLAETYLTYREWQKLAGKTKTCYHPYFHGSRDIYGTYNYLFHSIKSQPKKLLDLEGQLQQLKKTDPKNLEQQNAIKQKLNAEILSKLIEAIRRNMNGEVYLFGDPKNPKALSESFLGNYTADILPGGSLSKEQEDTLKAIQSIFKSKVDSIYFGQMLPENEKASRAIIPPSEVTQMYVRPAADTSKKPAFGKASAKKTVFYSLTSSEVFQYILYAWLKDRPEFKFIQIKNDQAPGATSALARESIIRDPGVKELVLKNIQDNNCRFMIVRTESTIIDDLFFRTLRNEHARKNPDATSQVDSKQSADPKEKADDWHVGANRIIDWRDVKDSENVNDLLSKFKTYVSNGYVVVMKNLQSLYGGLYDLFNQKYTLPQNDKEKTAEDSKRCFLYYGEAKTAVTVHPKFKCIILLDSGNELTLSATTSEIEKKFPAPFLNRFEKYFMHFSSVFHDPAQLEAILKVKERANKLCDYKFSRLPGLNMDYLLSTCFEEDCFGTPFAESREQIVNEHNYLPKLMRLASSNILLRESLTRNELESFKKAYVQNFANITEDALTKHNSLGVSPSNDQAFKKVVLTFSTKARFNQMVEADVAKLRDFERIELKSIYEGLLTNREKLFTKKRKPIIINFSYSKEFAYVPLVRRAIDESYAELAKTGTTQTNDSEEQGLPVPVILIIHLSKVDHDQYGFSVDSGTQGTRFIPNGERARLLESGAINNWGGWECMTVESLIKDFDLMGVFAVSQQPIVNCILKPDEKVLDVDQLGAENIDGVITYWNKLGIQTIKKLFLINLEDMSMKPEIYGEINLSKMRDLSKFFDSNQFDALFAKIRDTLAATSLIPNSGVKAVSRASHSDIFEDFVAILQRAFYEDPKNELGLKDFLARLNAKCRNLYTLFLGLHEDGSNFNPTDIEKNNQQKLLEIWKTNSIYGAHLLKSLDQLVKQADEPIATSQPSTTEEANKDQNTTTKAERFLSLRVPMLDEYTAMSKKYEELKQKAKEDGIWPDSERLTEYTVGLQKSILEGRQNSEDLVKLVEFEQKLIQILNTLMNECISVSEKKSVIQSKKLQPKSNSAQFWKNFTVDVLRMIFGKPNSKNPLFSLDSQGMSETTCDRLMDMSEKLMKKLDQTSTDQTTEFTPFIEKALSALVLCDVYAEETHEILNLTFTELSIITTNMPAQLSHKDTKLAFNFIGFHEILNKSRVTTVKFDIFKFGLKDIDDALRISETVKRMKANSKLNLKLKRLLVSSYEIIQHLLPIYRGDDFTRIMNALVNFDLDSLQQQAQKEENEGMDSLPKYLLHSSRPLVALILNNLSKVNSRIELLAQKEVEAKVREREQQRTKDRAFDEKNREKTGQPALTAEQQAAKLKEEQEAERLAHQRVVNDKPERIRAEQTHLVLNILQLLETSMLLAGDCAILTDKRVFDPIFQEPVFRPQDYKLVYEKLSHPIVHLLGNFYSAATTATVNQQLLQAINKSSSIDRHLKKLGQLMIDLTAVPQKTILESPRFHFLTTLMDTIYLVGTQQKDKLRSQASHAELSSDPSELANCLERAIKSYASRKFDGQNTELTLDFILAVTFVRIFYDDRMIEDFMAYPIESQSQVTNSIFGGFTDDGIDVYLKQPSAYPIVFLMQRLIQTEGKFTSRHKETVDLVKHYSSLTELKEDMTGLAIFDQELLDFYSKTVKAQLFEAQKENRSNTVNYSKLKALLSLNYKNSNSPVLYLVGVHYINLFLPGPKVLASSDDAQVKAQVGVMFAAYGKSFTSETMHSNFCKFMCSLCSHPDQVTWSKDTQLEQDAEDCSVFLKTLAHTALTVVCFSDKLGYKAAEPLKWLAQGQIDQDLFKSPVADSPEFRNGCESVHQALEFMYDGNLRYMFGMLKCQCGFMYTLPNCGNVPREREMKCWVAGCSGIKGSLKYGKDHPTQKRFTQWTALQEVNEIYKSNKKKYWSHRSITDQDLIYHMIAESPDTSDMVRLSMWNNKRKDNDQGWWKPNPSYDWPGCEPQFDRAGSAEKQQQAIQGIQHYKQDFRIKHCFDHVFVLASTFLMDETQRAQFREICMKTLDNNGSGSRYEEYFLKHMLDDFKAFLPNDKEKPRSDQLGLFKRICCKAAESIINGGSADSRTKLFLERKYFGSISASALKTEEEKRLKLELKNDQAQSATQIINLVGRTVDFDSSGSQFLPLFEYRLLMKVFPTIQFSEAKVSDLIGSQMSSGTIFSTVYKLAHDIYQHQELYQIFQNILGDPLALFQYVQSRYSGKKTHLECTQLTTGKLAEENKVFKEYFHNYCQTWKSSSLELLVERHAEVFQFGFDCRQGLDLQGYVELSTDPTKPVINIILIDKSSKYSELSLPIAKAMIQTLARKVQNSVVTQARRTLGLITEQTPLQLLEEIQSQQKPSASTKQTESWEKSIDIKYATKQDIFRLDFPDRQETRQLEAGQPPKDFRSFARQYARISENDGRRELEIDYRQLEQDLAQHLLKWSILNVEEPNFRNFEFKTDNNDAKELSETQKYLQLVRTVPSPEDDRIAQEVEERYGSLSESLKRCMGLISELCSELRQRCQYSAAKTRGQKLSVVQQLEQDDSDQFLRQFADNPDLKDDLQFLDSITLEQLPAVYKLMQDLRGGEVEMFFKKHGNVELESELETTINNGFQEFQIVCTNNQQCRAILENWYREIVTTMKDDFGMSMQALDLPLNGYVAVDSREDEIEIWEEHISADKHALIQEFYSALDDVPFKSAYYVMEKIKEC